MEQSASTSRKKKEKAQKTLDGESRVAALKTLHKLKMTELKAKHTAEKKRLKSALTKWENGVSHSQHQLWDCLSEWLAVLY